MLLYAEVFVCVNPAADVFKVTNPIERLSFIWTNTVVKLSVLKIRIFTNNVYEKQFIDNYNQILLCKLK